MKRMIIFDDDEDILSICGYILNEHGWEVHTFTNCEELESRVDAISPDVILMDNWIAPMGGIDATKTLKNSESFRLIPVVYFSANSDIESLAGEAGAESYLAKPFDLDELLRVVDEVAIAG